ASLRGSHAAVRRAPIIPHPTLHADQDQSVPQSPSQTPHTPSRYVQDFTLETQNTPQPYPRTPKQYMERTNKASASSQEPKLDQRLAIFSVYASNPTSTKEDLVPLFQEETKFIDQDRVYYTRTKDNKFEPEHPLRLKSTKEVANTYDQIRFWTPACYEDVVDQNTDW
ncbi:hypothetical protein HWV62_4633, partial [Athelia sp. TMB]